MERRAAFTPGAIHWSVITMVTALSAACVARRGSVSMSDSILPKECTDRFLGKHNENLLLLKALGGDRAL
jgi:hypothetical protein